MQPPTRALRCTRSRQDHDLYRLALPNHQPARTLSLTLSLPPHASIHPSRPVGALTLRPPDSPNSPTTYQLTTHITGVLQRVSDRMHLVEEGEQGRWQLEEGGRGGLLELCWVRECDHQPEVGENAEGHIMTQSTRPNSTRQQVCRHCKKQLWLHFDPNQHPITLQQLLKSNRHLPAQPNWEEWEWTVIVNEQFTRTTPIARLGQEQINMPYLAKATFLLDFQENHKSVRPETVVMKIRNAICSHEKIIDSRCQECLQEIKEEQVRTFERFLFQMDDTTKVNSGVMVKGAALFRQEQEFIKGLVQAKKAIMVLDLDNTILHSTDISELSMNTVLNLKDFYTMPRVDVGPEQKIRRDLIIVKMRPYLKHFLYELKHCYEIYVYTKGTRVYAQQICRYVREQYAGQAIHPNHQVTWKPQSFHFLKDSKAFQTHRIISRNQDGNLQRKSLQKILPSKKEYHLILDDRRDVWNNSPSWYFTRDYYYFLKKPTKAVKPNDDVSNYFDTNQVDLPEMKTKLCDQFRQIKASFPEKRQLMVQTPLKDDTFLLFAAHALKKIHNKFFETLARFERGESQTMRSLSYVHSKLKQFLMGVKVAFVLGEGVSLESSGVVRRAQKMGGLVAGPGESPRVVIRANNLMRQQPKDKKCESNSSSKETALIQQKKESQRQQVNEPSSTQNPPVQLTQPVLMSSELPAQEQIHNFNELERLNGYFNQRIPTVSQTWIHACYEFNYPFNCESFRLHDPFKQDVEHDQFNSVIEETANNIRKDIEARMQAEERRSIESDSVVHSVKPPSVEEVKLNGSGPKVQQ